MWLKEYLRSRWGLFGLVGGVTLSCAWAFGSAPADTARTRAGTTTAKPGRPQPKALTPASVSAVCAKHAIPVSAAAQPRHAAVEHPGFPKPGQQPPRLAKSSRGLFQLRQKLAEIAVKRLAHAPLMHRLARGFAERSRYFAHLVRNREAATRYYLRRARRSNPGTPPGAAGGPGRKFRTPAAAVIAAEARTHRVRAKGYYRQLTTLPIFAKYRGRAAALLERASLLMTDPPPRGARLDRKSKDRLRRARLQERTLAVDLLHRLVETHASTPEGVEAMTYLADREAAKGKCAKVLFLLRRLPSGAIGPRTGPRHATLRAFGHYHAGRCLARKSKTEAAVKRLAQALSDGRIAAGRGSKMGPKIARQAAILLARALSTSEDLPRARTLFAGSGPALSRLQLGVLAAQLVKAGKLQEALQLCTPPNTPQNNRQNNRQNNQATK